MRTKTTFLLTVIVLSIMCTLAKAQFFAPDPFKNNQKQDAGAPGPDAVHISKISVLTLNKDRDTTYRRTSAVPQLKCVGGSARNDGYRPKSVQCYNKGSDGTTINWKCEAEMSKKYKFGRLNVACEGYRFAGDEWVLKGSCGLQYELDYTGKGGYNSNNTPVYDEADSTGFSPFALIALVIVVVLVYKCCIARPQTSNLRPTSTTTNSNMYPGASAPPFNPDYMGTHHNQNKFTPHTSQTSSTSGPGFWTGATVGAATGFMAGRATAPSQNTYTRDRTWDDHSYSSTHTYRDDDEDRTATGFATTSSR